MDDPLLPVPKLKSFRSSSTKKQLIQQMISEKFAKLEHQIKTQKKLITDLRDETIALRENNIKLQVENFKLQRKLNEIESAKSKNLSSDSLSQSFSWNSLNEELESGSEDFLEDIFKSFEETEEETLNPEDSFEIEETNSPEEPKIEEPKRKLTIVTSKAKQNVIAAVKSGPKNDAVFVSKCLDAFFERETLMKSTVSGLPCKNKNFVRKGYEQLNPDKVNLIKKMLSERIRKENVSYDQLETRMKKLNAHVNTKIQNVRKHYYKKRKDQKGDWWLNYDYS